MVKIEEAWGNQYLNHDLVSLLSAFLQKNENEDLLMRAFKLSLESLDVQDPASLESHAKVLKGLPTTRIAQYYSAGKLRQLVESLSEKTLE